MSDSVDDVINIKFSSLSFEQKLIRQIKVPTLTGIKKLEK